MDAMTQKCYFSTTSPAEPHMRYRRSVSLAFFACVRGTARNLCKQRDRQSSLRFAFRSLRPERATGISMHATAIFLSI